MRCWQCCSWCGSHANTTFFWGETTMANSRALIQTKTDEMYHTGGQSLSTVVWLTCQMQPVSMHKIGKSAISLRCFHGEYPPSRSPPRLLSQISYLPSKPLLWPSLWPWPLQVSLALFHDFTDMTWTNSLSTIFNTTTVHFSALSLDLYTTLVLSAKNSSPVRLSFFKLSVLDPDMLVRGEGWKGKGSGVEWLFYHMIQPTVGILHHDCWLSKILLQY